MRIAVINHEYPPLGGGAATACEQISRQLASLGNRVRVVTSSGLGLPEYEARADVEVVRLPTGRRSRFAPSGVELLRFCSAAQLRLTGCLRDFRADAVLAFFAVPAGQFAVRSAQRLGLPVVVSIRGSDAPGFSPQRLGGWIGWCAKRFVRSTLAAADAVAPNCRRLEQLVLRAMPELAGKMQLVPNGVDAESIASAPASSGSDDLRMVTVGQLIPRKGIEFALAALRHLLDDGVPARLTVVGDGPQARALQTRADDLRIADRVDFAGYVERHDVVELLRRHDVFVMPSRSEGMSNAVLEAMAAGLPVVTTANGAHDMVLAAGCGIVTRVDEALALAAAVRRLALDPDERMRFAEAALRQARRWTWRASAEQMSRLLASPAATQRIRAASNDLITHQGCLASCAESQARFVAEHAQTTCWSSGIGNST